MNAALIIMAKVPKAGNVKTRLQPFLTEDLSAQIAGLFIKETEIKANKIESRITFAISPIEEKNSFDGLLVKSHKLSAQAGLNLGDRMSHAFSEAFESGALHVVLIGTDCPQMTTDDINNAFDKLRSGSGAVLGPSDDGGFYLIGLNKLPANIFENVEWGSDQAFEKTRNNLNAAGIEPDLVTKRTDIDTKTDLQSLYKILAADKSAAPLVASWMRANDHLFRTSE